MGNMGNDNIYRWAEPFVYRKVKSALGLDACVTFLSGAAPISDEVVTFFKGFDINILNIYGLSETTGRRNLL